MKTVLITGAGGGIGKKTSLYFAKNGWTVIATLLHTNEAEDLKIIGRLLQQYYLQVKATISKIFRMFFATKWMLLQQKVSL